MRKLTNIYIEVTSRNVNELMKLINRYDLKPNTYILFNYECITSSVRTFVIPKNRKKVKLSVLKHLVDTIPTREEIISLKRQIEGYKTSLDNIEKKFRKEKEIIFRREIENLIKFSNICEKLDQEKMNLWYELDQLKRKKHRKWWQIWK